MDLKATIREAWDFAQEEKTMMYWYAFLPALISTIAGIIYIAYQAINFKRYFAHEQGVIGDLIQAAWQFVSSNPTLLPIILGIAVVIAILYLLYPSYCEGALIQLIARRHNGQEIKMSQGIIFGAKTFFPFLEFNGLLSFFSLSALLGYATIILRTLGPDILKFMSIFFILVAVLSVVMSFLFSYAQYFMAIDHDGVFSAIGKSTNLVVTNWHSTFLVVLLLLLIGLRVIVNLILIIVIPSLILLVAGFFASIALTYIGNILAVIFVLAGLFLAGYLGGIMSVFSHAVWTLTFLKLTSDGELSARDS